MKKRPIRIKERKLGRELAAGQSYLSRKLIEIDPRQSNKAYLDTLIHETLHLIYPRLTEKEVVQASRVLTKNIWKQGYRRIYN